MKHLFTISLALILVLPEMMMAQKLSDDFELTVSKPFPVVDAIDKQYFAVGEGNSISVKTRGELVTLQLFSGDDMKELSRKEYDDFPKYNKVQKVLQIGDRLIYISEAYNKKDKNFSVYAREINTQEGSFSTIKKLFTTSRPVADVRADFGQEGGLFSMGMHGAKFGVSISSDESKVMIQYRLKPASRRDRINKDEIGFCVFDSDLEQLWANEVTMPYTEKEMNNVAYTVTRDGKARMLALKREEKKYELITIDEDGLRTVPLAIPGEVTFQKLKLKENEDGTIICAGFYANGIIFNATYGVGVTARYSTDGYAVFNISPEGEVIDYHFGEFPAEFIKLNRSARDQKRTDKDEAKDKAGINDLALLEFHIEDDGSILLIGERQFLTTEVKYYGGKPRTIQVANFGNVVLIKLNADGDLIWMRKIAKRQKPSSTFSTSNKLSRGGMGVKYIRNADSHYILYLDNIKNNDLSLNEAPYRHEDGMGGFLVAVKINDANGEMERHPLLDLREDVGGIKVHQFKTSRLFDIYPKTMMLETYIKGKEDVMVKLDLMQ